MSDNETTVSEIKEAVRDFDKKRNWEKKVLNTAISISLEASELLEIFQWCDQSGAEKAARGEKREHFLEELADVMIYCIELANVCDVDIASAIEDKMRKNAVKYPEKQ